MMNSTPKFFRRLFLLVIKANKPSLAGKFFSLFKKPQKFNLKPLLLFGFFLFYFSFNTKAQEKNVISGKITDESNTPLPGVSVQVKNTSIGTISDINGGYRIEGKLGQTLVFSILSFKPFEAIIDTRVINVTLKSQSSSLDEVVVIGYGSQQKRDVVGSVVSVSNKDLKGKSNTNVFDALQGVAPGITINRGNGSPNSTANILIRGQNSITASNSPLIVLDGTPYYGNILDINPNDIESLEVLKDASAAAIYGSQASNGVILITSVKGKTGKPKISVNLSNAFNNPTIKPNLQTPEEFYSYRQEAFRAAGKDTSASNILYSNELDLYNKGKSVDWYDLLMNNNARLETYQIGVNGGSENVKYNLSSSYTGNEGLLIGTDYKRTTLKPNLEVKITDWLTAGDDLLYAVSKNNPTPYEGTYLEDAYYFLTPYSKIYENDGSYTLYPTAGDNFYSNIFADSKLKTRDQQSFRIFNNLYANLKIPFIKGLGYQIRYGQEYNNQADGYYWPSSTVAGGATIPAAPKGLASTFNANINRWSLDNIITYNKKFKNHTIDFTGLLGRQHYNLQSTTASSSGFVSDDYLYYNLAAGSAPGIPASNFDDWEQLSYMGRINYNYKSKYYLTTTARYDGYSGFGQGNKFGFFPSFALAWRLSEESFMKQFTWLDNLKIRYSLGEVGNQAVGTNQSVNQLISVGSLFGQTNVNGTKISDLGNKNLKWETTRSANYGLDFELLKSRISGAIDYYDTKTFDLLLSKGISVINGDPDGRILDNIGKVSNKGFELQLNGTAVKSTSFKWNIGLNFTTNKNKILELNGKQDDPNSSRFIGQPIGVIYDYKFIGVWQTNEIGNIPSSAQPDAKPGDPKIEDFSHDNMISPADRQIVGYTQPKWTAGLNNNFTYKNFSLSFLIYTVQGVDKRVKFSDFGGRFRNYNFSYWTPENPTNQFIRPNQLGIKNYGSMDVYDASFIRLKNATLRYALPEKVIQKLKMSRVEFTATLRDYFTITNFPFTDPESNTGTTGATYPLSKTVEFGLSINL